MGAIRYGNNEKQSINVNKKIIWRGGGERKEQRERRERERSIPLDEEEKQRDRDVALS